MTYKCIHTSYGLQRIAAAEATGVPINLPTMAVGDGNGNEYTPTEAQTGLVREMYRAAVNTVYQDPGNPLQFVAELIIPESTGGFVVREAAIFDSTGSMFAVSSVPATYKPLPTDGAFGGMVVRLVFRVSNASSITIIADPSAVVATRTWIQNTITAAFLLPGGTVHQILRKRTNADGDVEWADPGDVNVIVSVEQETQTLAAGQTAVTLSVTTTNGLALYIEGARLRPDQWSVVDDTHLTLASSYPTGTKLHLVQNDPLGTTPYPLARDLNLSDVPNKATARANLDVFSKAEVRQLVFPGMLGHTAGTVAPPGWLKRNGAAISRTAYPELFAVIGTIYGPGDGFNTFNLPDDRGLFTRNLDDGKGIDPGRTVGSWQASQNLEHSHFASSNPSGSHNHLASSGSSGSHKHESSWGENPATASPPFGAADAFANRAGSNRTDFDNYSWLTSEAGLHNHEIYVSQNGEHSHVVNVGASGGNESRPFNTAYLAIIKY